jgi:hypothetical protein
MNVGVHAKGYQILVVICAACGHSGHVDPAKCPLLATVTEARPAVGKAVPQCSRNPTLFSIVVTPLSRRNVWRVYSGSSVVTQLNNISLEVL